MTTRRRALHTLAAGLAACTAGRALAQPGWPEKPLRLIVPYPAGGGADSWARIVAARLEKALGTQVVFEYRPGGSTTIGAEAAARAPADGYTFHLYDSTAFAYVPNMRRVPYDPIGSFVPLAYLGVLPFVLVAHPSLPVRDVPELIAHAKANPGKLNCASAGVGSPHHLIAELFKMRNGIAMNHVPYKGAAQYVADLVGGQVDLAVSTIGPAAPHIQTGKLRALGVSTAKRTSALPDVPTIAEQGVEGFDEKPWNVFVAPAGVPAGPLERLRGALRESIADPEVQAALRRAGVEEIGTMHIDRVADAMRADLTKWGEVIRRANITLEN
ncbi:MAG TPA: tripartite tricarboxylate transporter substrate binding protein [Burkholderiaceae bacterium]|nr:tripartite tricarboxylate transporter substrate binding protein [Burkholderiaceae bacterium]